MENYWQAKWQLFTHHLSENGRAVISSTVKPAPDPEELHAREVLFTGDNKSPGDLTLISCTPGLYQTELSFKWRKVSAEGSIPLTGRHNIENFLIALALAEKALRHLPAVETWSSIPQIPGRLERVQPSGKGLPTVYVDYAHTPDALENVLKTLRDLPCQKLWVVFGCGGDRDKGKRPQMAAAVEAWADKILLTSDNPRSEDPAEIIRQVAQGFSEDADYDTEEDRDTAIRTAVLSAGEHDLVLIAGKGHETSQTIGDRILDFDDRLVAVRYLRKKREKHDNNLESL